jgi:hypothetical protein
MTTRAEEHLLAGLLQVIAPIATPVARSDLVEAPIAEQGRSQPRTVRPEVVEAGPVLAAPRAVTHPEVVHWKTTSMLGTRIGNDHDPASSIFINRISRFIRFRLRCRLVVLIGMMGRRSTAFIR